MMEGKKSSEPKWNRFQNRYWNRNLYRRLPRTGTGTKTKISAPTEPEPESVAKFISVRSPAGN